MKDINQLAAHVHSLNKRWWTDLTTGEPTPDAALNLIDQIMGGSEPIPAQVFDLISPTGRAAALISWVAYHIENPQATTFTMPGSGRSMNALSPMSSQLTFQDLPHAL